MQRLFIFAVLFISLAHCSIQTDLLALRSFYEATGGANWTNNAGWNNGTSDVYCDWFGIECNVTSDKLRINLSHNNLVGQISPNFTLLNITHLNLSNNTLYGSLSEFFFPEIKELDLSHNKLNGSIDLYFYNSTKLRHLDLSNNSFSGNISELIGNMRRLEYVDLSHNQFLGPIPEGLGSPRLLYHLDISHNQFNGSLPSSLSENPLDTLMAQNNSIVQVEYHMDFEVAVPRHCDLSNNPLICPMPGWAKDKCKAVCDPMWSAASIVTTVFVSLFLLGSIAYLIWFFIDRKRANDSYTRIS